MKRYILPALLLAGFFLAGRYWSELSVHAGGGGAFGGNGDIDGDGFINVTDVIGLLNWMFLGGDAPVAYADGVVSGGGNNKASGLGSFVAGGGWDNGGGSEACADFSAILGGSLNLTGDPNRVDHSIGVQSTVSAGLANNASGKWASACGGARNKASGEQSSISGGDTNSVTAKGATVSGGCNVTLSTQCGHTP